jgi:hypothetical protein
MKYFILILALLALSISPMHVIQTASAVAYTKTFADVEQFLLYDDTHLNTWTPEFDCVQFSEMMVQHARQQGFAAVVVTLDYQQDYDGYTGHDIVAIYTIDQGVVWIEPQNNSFYSDNLMKSGIKYRDGWYIESANNCLHYIGLSDCNSVPIATYTYEFSGG